MAGASCTRLSIVILTSDWSPILARTLESVKDLGDELLLYDSGSSNDVREAAKTYGARVIRGEWRSYGETRKRACLSARNDWILAIDSDEVLDDMLRRSIAQVDLGDARTAYSVRFRSFIGNKEIRHGEWGHQSHIRLANRNAVTLEARIVHEGVVLHPGVRVKTLKGSVLHYTARNIGEYSRKMLRYAGLSADKYRREGRRFSGPRLFLSPPFSFLRNYVLRLGFLDGWEGFLCAAMSSWYAFLKYACVWEGCGEGVRDCGHSAGVHVPEEMARRTQLLAEGASGRVR